MYHRLYKFHRVDRYTDIPNEGIILIAEYYDSTLESIGSNGGGGQGNGAGRARGGGNANGDGQAEGSRR